VFYYLFAAPQPEEVPMRWNNLSDTAPDAVPALFGTDVVTRTFDTPEFRGITFHEVRARSIVNRVPGTSRMAFTWTVNPYRGCSHACVYCFARKSHSYLDLDTGADFDSQIVVKVNAPQLLRRELGARRWTGEHIAMGTNVDTYQRAEGRYRLMPGIIAALRDHANPFSILTKGTLILRDLPLLRQAADVTDVGISVSVGFIDESMWRSVEPGTPAPERRLDVVRAMGEAGIGCGVLMAPVLPFLTDSPEQLRATVRAVAAAGATSVTPLALHLRPGGAREWYMAWLARHHPDLVSRYRAMYGNGSYAPKWYQRRITRQVHELAAEYGMGPVRPPGAHRMPADAGEAAAAVREEAAAAQPAESAESAEPAEPAEPEASQLTLL
jgi:DNA repair photolyase